MACGYKSELRALIFNRKNAAATGARRCLLPEQEHFAGREGGGGVSFKDILQPIPSDIFAPQQTKANGFQRICRSSQVAASSRSWIRGNNIC